MCYGVIKPRILWALFYKMTAPHPKYTKSMVKKDGGDGIMLWGCFSSARFGAIFEKFGNLAYLQLL